MLLFLIVNNLLFLTNTKTIKPIVMTFIKWGKTYEKNLHYYSLSARLFCDFI